MRRLAVEPAEVFVERFLDRAADLVAAVDAQCFSHAARASLPRSDACRTRPNASRASTTSAPCRAVVEALAEHRRVQSKNRCTAASCACRRLRRVDLAAERVAAREVPRVPAEMLARDAHARLLAVERVVIVEVRSDRARASATVGGGSSVPWSRKCAISRKIHGRPCAARPIISASAPVCVEHALRLLGRVDVAVGDHRNRDRRLTAAMVSYSTGPTNAQARVRPCTASAAMPASSAMRAIATRVAVRRDPGRCGSSASPAPRPRATTAARIAATSGSFGEQRRAGRGVAHLLRRAAHVDVDDLRAALDVVARGVGHHARDRRRRSARRWAPTSPA